MSSTRTYRVGERGKHHANEARVGRHEVWEPAAAPPRYAKLDPRRLWTEIERESIGAAAKTTATMTTTTTTTTARPRLHRRAHRWETRQQLRRSPPLAILPTTLTIIVVMALMIAVRIAVLPRPPPHARVLAI